MDSSAVACIVAICSTVSFVLVSSISGIASVMGEAEIDVAVSVSLSLLT